MIGVFDSGVGGLSVFREIYRLMPAEEYIYIADSAHCPYGSKPASEITERAARISEYLIRSGCRMIVVACNTATAAAISYLRKNYSDTVFVGMEPAVKPAATSTESGVIGVLATKGTLCGELYHNTLARFASGVSVVETIGEGLVEIVESGQCSSEKAESLLRKYIGPMIDAGADKIVLGCTHYPFLAGTIRKLYGDSVGLVDPAPAIASRCEYLVRAHSLSSFGSRLMFCTTGRNAGILEDMVRANFSGIEARHPEFKTIVI